MMAVAGLCIGMNAIAGSYDAKLAKSYAELFAPVVEAKAGKALHFVKPEAFINDLNAGKEFVTLDVRTAAEARLFTLSLPHGLAIPLDQLFQPKNLDRIPSDKPVMVICKSGARATAAGTALRHIGFSNVYILKGGFEALSTYYGPAQAYAKPEPDEK